MLKNKNLQIFSAIASLFALCCLLTACVSSPYLWVQALPTPAAHEHLLTPGDTVNVQVIGHENLSGKLTIRLDGSLGLPLVGTIQAQGESLESLALAIQGAVTPLIEAPEVHVALISTALVRIGVMGEVKSPDYFVVAPNQGVLSLLARAGGLTEYAHEDQIFVVRTQATTPRIRFRMVDLESPNTAASRFLLMNGDTIIVE